MKKEKYIQLCLAHQFGGINVIDIHSRCRAFEETAENKEFKE